MTKLAALCLAAVVTATSMGMATTPSVAHGKGGVSFGLSFGSPHYYSYRPYRHRYYPAYPRRHYRPSYDAHVSWCYDRYRSYRAWDNTFQPYNGPRRQCRSPYG